MDERWVIVISAGALQVPCVEAAHSLGLQVIVTDRNAGAPAVNLADDFFAIDTYDHRGHRDLVRWLIDKKHRNIVGCFTAGADVAPTVAACAEEAGTPGIPFDVAQRIHDKAAVRKVLRDAGLQQFQPHWLHGWTRMGMDISVQGTVWEELPTSICPVIVKPLHQCASRGVSIVRSREELLPAFMKVEAFEGDPVSPAGVHLGCNVLIEEYLTGSEHSAEIILDSTRGSDAIFFNVVDRVFRYDGGIPMELGHVNPSRLSTHDQMVIYDLLCEAAKALGVTWGAFKADIIVTADGPKILEVTARLSGGWDSSVTTPLSSGRNPIRVVCAMACGLPIKPEDITGDKRRYAACAAVFPKPGKIISIKMPDWPEFRAMGIDKVILNVQPGQAIPEYEHNAHRLAFCIASAADYDQAWANASDGAEILARSIVTE